MPHDAHLTETRIPGLLATPPTPLPYVAGANVRSFLLERADGNVLVYNSPNIAASADDIERRGGATRLLVNHAHEEMYGDPGIGVPIFVGARDRAEAAGSLQIAGTFAGPETIGDDLHVIPTPGHTPGTTTYLWDSGDHRVLFTGDTIWLENGDWSAVVLGSSDRRDFLDSLELLRNLEFDVLVPWGALGERYLDVVEPAEARKRMGVILGRVRAGSDR